MSFRGRRKHVTESSRESSQSTGNATSLIESILSSRDSTKIQPHDPPTSDIASSHERVNTKPSSSAKPRRKEKSQQTASQPTDLSKLTHIAPYTSSGKQSKPPQSHSQSHPKPKYRHKPIPDISSIVPLDEGRECLICSHPITIFVATSCSHTNELCGTCVLKSLLFSKPQKGKSSGDDNERPPYAIKQSYQDLCASSQSLSTTNPKVVSDPHLDANYVSYCRSRDPLCWFCHSTITPVLMSTSPISSDVYDAFRAALVIAKYEQQSNSTPDHNNHTQKHGKKGKQGNGDHPEPGTAHSRDEYQIALDLIAKYTKSPHLLQHGDGLTSTPTAPAPMASTTLTASEPSPSVTTTMESNHQQDDDASTQKQQHLQLQRASSPLSIDYIPSLDIYAIRQPLRIYFEQPRSPSEPLPHDPQTSKRTLTVHPRQYSLAEIVDKACSISCRIFDNLLETSSGDDSNHDTMNSIYTQTTHLTSNDGLQYETHPVVTPLIQHITYPLTGKGNNPPKRNFIPSNTKTPLTITPLQRQQQSFTSLRHLQYHLGKSHSLEMCIACASVSYDFIPQRPIYNRSQLIAHANREKHSICQLCYRQCYDDDELYAHLIDPSSGHLQCHHCTMLNTIDQSSLMSKLHLDRNENHQAISSSHQNTSLTEQKFLFVRSAEALIAHYYDQHLVCEVDVCKSLTDPYSMSVFSSQMELQAHQAKCHHIRQANREIDLASFTRAFGSSDSSNTSTTTTITLGSDGRRTYSHNPKNHSKRFTIGPNDVFQWKRIIGLSSLNFHEQTRARELFAQQRGIEQSSDSIPSSASRSSHAAVDVTPGSGYGVVASTSGAGKATTPGGSYEEMFPSLSLSGSLGKGPTASASKYNFAGALSSSHNRPSSQSKKSTNELFPVLGGSGGAGSTKPSTLTNKTGGGNTQTSGKPKLSHSMSSSSSSTTTTPAMSQQPKQDTTSTKPQKPKVNRLDQLINWQSSSSSSSRNQSTSKSSRADDPFGDYEQYLQSTDHNYYESKPVVNPFTQDLAKAASKPPKQSSSSSSSSDSSKSTKDETIKVKETDFPSTLGTSQLSQTLSWNSDNNSKDKTKSKKQSTGNTGSKKQQQQNGKSKQQPQQQSKKNTGGFLSPPATVAGGAWGAQPSTPQRSIHHDLSLMQRHGLTIDTSSKKKKKK